MKRINSAPRRNRRSLGAGAEQALEPLETLLALIEGWVQLVVIALGDWIPGAAALGEEVS